MGTLYNSRARHVLFLVQFSIRMSPLTKLVRLLAKENATKAGPVGIKQQDFSALVVLPLPERLLQYFPPNYPVGATNYPTHGFNYEQCRDMEALVRGIIAHTDGCCRLLLHQ